LSSNWITTSTILHGLRDFENRDAWERFASRFRAPILRLALDQGLTRTDAEDVAQETLIGFAKAFREGRYDAQKGRLSRWLFGIAYRQVMHARASREHRGALEPQRAESATWSEVADEDAAARTWDLEWERTILAQCMHQVRSEVQPVTFRAFELTAIDQRDAEAAALELGVPVKVVYNAKHRILKRVRELRQALEEASP
jgi:RNA polymerase sigma-70 factor (ECF subfamily)